MGLPNKIKVYIISDDYKWHHFTDDPKYFYQLLGNYVVTLATSEKDNSYYIFTLSMTREEYEVLKKNQYNKNNKPKLELVKDVE